MTNSCYCTVVSIVTGEQNSQQKLAQNMADSTTSAKVMEP